MEEPDERQTLTARSVRGIDIDVVRDWAFDHRGWLYAAALAALAVVLITPRLASGSGARPAVEQTLPRAVRPAVTLPEPIVIVHASGSVRVPGVYRVDAGARVGDVVEAAGGFLDDADPDRVNLAAIVRDGDQVHIPAVDEVLPSSALGSAASAVVDINRADAAGLEALVGIGPSLAAAIIEHRNRHGPFASVGDLEAVPGIGPATVDRFRDMARV